MASTINTNLISINAQRNLALSGSALATSMQRLSSGLRVNSAKDDAAGLAIAERMNSQIRGLQVAARNANDGIALAQTAEGAMQKLGDILQRSRELAVQAANWTNSPSDRQALNQERLQLMKEFSRITSTSHFNGHKLLDGSLGAQVFQVGANSGETIGVHLPSLQPEVLGGYRSKLQNGYYEEDGWHGTFSISGFNSIVQPVNAYSMNGTPIPSLINESAAAITERINSQNFNPPVTAYAKTSISILYDTSDFIDINLQISGKPSQTIRYSPQDGINNLSIVQEINAKTAETGLRAELLYRNTPPYSAIIFISDSGENIKITNNNLIGNLNFGYIHQSEKGGSMSSVHSGYLPSQQEALVLGGIEIYSESSFSYGIPKIGYDYDFNEIFLPNEYIENNADIFSINDISFDTQKSASQAISIIDGALRSVNQARAQVGAIQARFEAVIDNIDIQAENLSAARGRIVDADFAKETGNLSRAQILQQAGTAMLAQANQIPQSVLQLLKG